MTDMLALLAIDVVKDGSRPTGEGSASDEPTLSKENRRADERSHQISR
jgi:hypothetical protein